MAGHWILLATLIHIYIIYIMYMIYISPHVAVINYSFFMQAKWWPLQSLPLFNLGWNVVKHFRDFLREEKGERKARTRQV